MFVKIKITCAQAGSGTEVRGNPSQVPKNASCVLSVCDTETQYSTRNVFFILKNTSSRPFTPTRHATYDARILNVQKRINNSTLLLLLLLLRRKHPLSVARRTRQQSKEAAGGQPNVAHIDGVALKSACYIGAWRWFRVVSLDAPALHSA